MAEWILGIETSCDETSAAVLAPSGGRPSSPGSSILSQDVHRIFGGVVPELASRAHVQTLGSVVDRALADAGIGLAQSTAIAVTAGPGLVGALLVGVMLRARPWRSASTTAARRESPRGTPLRADARGPGADAAVRRRCW